MNFRQLKYFVQVVETGSITRAAEQLFVSQPALGLQIRLLEQTLGMSLLDRHSRGVSPTRAGHLLYERAREILRLIDETRQEIAAASQPEKENILVGLTNGLIKVISRDIVQQARRDLPDVNLRLIEEMSGVLADAVERRDIDLALAYEISERPGLIRVPLLEEELLFITAADDKSSPGAIEFSDLMDRPLALPGRRDGTHQLLSATARRLAREPNVGLEITSVAATIHMVAQGDAQSVVPYGTAIEYLDQGMLTGRRIVNPSVKRTLYLVRAARRASFANEEALLDLLGRQVVAFAARLGELATRLETLDTPLSLLVAKAETAPRPPV